MLMIMILLVILPVIAVAHRIMSKIRIKSMSITTEVFATT